MQLALSALALTAAAAAARRSYASRLAPSLTGGAARALGELVAALEAAGIRVRVGSTGRSLAAQERAYEQGRTATMNSPHQRGTAVDLYPIDPSTGFPDYAGKNLELYRRMHAIAAGLGWRGLAFNPDGSLHYVQRRDGRRFWDGGHLEWTGAAA